MRPTKLLVRWRDAYVWVGDGDRLGYLELGSMPKPLAIRTAGRELQRLAGLGTQIDFSIDTEAYPPHPDDALFSGWRVGDFVWAPTRSTPRITTLDDDGRPVLDVDGKVTRVGGEAARVMRVRFDQDDNGTLSVSGTLSSLLDHRAVRMQRAITRMINGSLEGSSPVAQPIVTPEYVPARPPQQTPETFSWSQDAILNWRTGPWSPDVRGRLAQMYLRRGRSDPPVAGDVAGDLRVAFIVDGVTLDEGIIFDGDEEGIFGGTGVDFGPANKLELQPTTVPAGTVSLTARVIQTHYH